MCCSAAGQRPFPGEVGGMKRTTAAILGGGTGGTLLANRLRRAYEPETAEIIVVDRDGDHVYQPGLLFVPFGRADVQRLARDHSRVDTGFGRAHVRTFVPANHRSRRGTMAADSERCCEDRKGQGEGHARCGCLRVDVRQHAPDCRRHRGQARHRLRRPSCPRCQRPRRRLSPMLTWSWSAGLRTCTG